MTGVPAASVTVTCSARLHLGFLDLSFTRGRRFGSLGLSLDAPRTRVVLRHGGPPAGPAPDRAGRYLATLAAHLGLEAPHALTVEAAMPPHAGLGSGTQLALAVGAALRALHGLAPDPRADAAVLGRGLRSGVGIGLFNQGGVVVDGGHGALPGPPPLLARLPVPEDWRVILVLDPARQGLSGATEAAAFAALPPLPDAATAEVCRLVLMQALPALAEDGLEEWGAAIARVQAIVGDHFAPAQGGRVASPSVALALAALDAAGAVGIGQSSWGPTGFAFVRGEAAARRLAAALTAAPAGKGLDFLVCRGLNRGATVETGA